IRCCNGIPSVLADGITYTFGILYVEYLWYFGESKGDTAWIASILVGVTLGSGPIASAFTNKYGCRPVTIAGAIISSIGMGISMFAPSVAFLYLSVGLLTGFGFGLIYLPAIVSVTCYFDKKRSFATGIAVCGSGIGTFLFAPLTEWLVQNFSWKGAMLILSGICLNNVFFGALFRPLEPVQKKDTPLNVLKDSHEDKQLLPVKTLNGKVPFEGSTRSSKSGSFHEECRMTSSSPHLTVPEQENESDCGSEGTLQKLRSRSVANSRQDSQQSLSGVMYRQDILYSRSLTNLPQNKYEKHPLHYSDYNIDNMCLIEFAMDFEPHYGKRYKNSVENFGADDELQLTRNRNVTLIDNSKIGLKINVKKTSSLRLGISEDAKVTLGNEKIDQVDSFTYLDYLTSTVKK
ncbi:monocarboxylate transporter 12-B-like, partial [Artemia franciscana]|uniref:monocarboxylate transporter 12-B-like n=1 Tax=Artemia franciscana TaxID=6661 RepID=UPI0032DA42BD